MSTKSCIEQCQECHVQCMQASAHAVTLEADPTLITTLADCARVAEATGGLLRRLPDLQAMTGRVCADICQRCFDSLSAFPDDSVFAACAQAAKACAETCRALPLTESCGTETAAMQATKEENAEDAAAEDVAETEVSSFGFMDVEPVELVAAEQHG